MKSEALTGLLLIERSIAEEAASRIVGMRAGPLTDPELRAIIEAFRLTLTPMGRRGGGRKRSASLDAAYADWEAGITGSRLYLKHIPQYSTMGRWRRRAEQHRLMNSIYSRRRRGRKPASALSPPLMGPIAG